MHKGRAPAYSVQFPASLCLVAAANPCLCQGPGGRSGCCMCPPSRLHAYRSRLSGPLLDRIDLQVEVPRLTRDELFDLEPAEPSAVVRDRVVKVARSIADLAQADEIGEIGQQSSLCHAPSSSAQGSST